MGELQVGDQVFDEHGKPCNVTWVSPVWRDRPVYAVTVETQGEATEVILADAEHLWQVRGEPQPVQTQALAARGTMALVDRFAMSHNYTYHISRPHRGIVGGVEPLPGAGMHPAHGSTTPHYLSFELAGRADTVCITVDNPSHLFLAGRSCVPTHNSTYTSVLFPSYVMGREPGSNVLVVSYGSDLPRKFGRRCRSIVQQPAYRRIFDTGLQNDIAAADQWALQNGSEFMGSSIQGGITGTRASGVVWDDLVKGRTEADSEIVRTRTWESYRDDLLSRKLPNAWEVAVGTRWHEDDPIGRILPENYAGESGDIMCRDGNVWHVVCLPAIADRADDVLGRKIGERIWPEWFGPDHFTPFMRDPRSWSSLYMQKPSPGDGLFFRAEHFVEHDEAPLREALKIYGSTDAAVSADQGDYTVHCITGVDSQDRLWLLDVWRQQAPTDVWIDAMADLMRKWNPFVWLEEGGVIQKAVDPVIKKTLAGRKIYTYRDSLPSIGNKEARAVSIRGHIAVKGMHIVRGSPWWPAMRSELLSFPAGRYDDQVDALSLIGRAIHRLVKGREPPPADRVRWEGKRIAVDMQKGIPVGAIWPLDGDDDRPRSAPRRIN